MHSRACCELALSRPAPSSFTILSHITSYVNRIRAFVSARRTRQGLSGRRLRGSLEQLRVTRLLNVEHRGSRHHCTSCINGGTSSARQEHTDRVKARGVRRLHKLHQRWCVQCAPGAHGPSKGSRCAKIAQAASTAVRVVRTRSTRVE